ncbi:Alpha-1,3-mannosyltransferase-like protein [Purpureocillium takamizusanense]|uniref:Alpha-1,3/1,6-mannosyltransferase ALG2 n=1 Tax=Purpureocillium takamizusanense TaxID=2060973 RepID=A0A9Q8QNW3_9HYPO|nr:Alpha-1,3-mannosyltransferase-like protein [Purpureocillium takamizusanense]UNI24684.1 Alpha-1,3-mannosyltransferase-like protein [Purpureocillium takamizusanense]
MATQCPPASPPQPDPATAPAATTTGGSGSGSGDSGASGIGTIIFFHPDLGIGGAERLVVDAAVGLQQRGHRVVIFTNHCDPSHCFDECRDGTLDVRVRGAWLVPSTILSRLAILCAILRHLHLLLHITLFTTELASLRPRAVVVDQLSAGLPILRYVLDRGVPVLFYCHFPDLLLARGRDASLAKRLYRVPFDAIEQWTMAFAHAVAVNSDFTRSVVNKTWPRLQHRVPIKVVYPCVDVDGAAVREDDDGAKTGAPINDGEKLLGGDRVVLSINRFERKKDIGLAIKAFAAIPAADRKNVRLVLAGGYDPRVSENVEYHTELEALASSLSLAHHTVTPPSKSSPSSTPAATLSAVPPSASVIFLLSVPHALKTALLRAASLLVYTPSNEHFGIVPLEAMLARVPVLAANTGGPVETVSDPAAGWLRDPADPAAWSAVMRAALAMPPARLAAMGDEGARRVRERFGRDKMAQALDGILGEIRAANPRPPFLNYVINLVLLVVFFYLGLLLASTYRRFVRA